MKVNKLLFPTDFSEIANRALDHALVFAHRFEAELIMLHVETPHGSDPHNPKNEFPDLDTLFSFIRATVSGRVVDPEMPVISGSISTREEVVRGISAAEEILSFAEEEDIDLVVMGTHGHSGIGRFLLGSTTEKVIHGSLKPVLTMGHGEDPFIMNRGNYRRILLPIDYSEASRGVVRYGLEIARLADSEVVFVHVMEPVVTAMTTYSGEVSQARVDPEIEQRSELALHKFVGDQMPPDYEFYLRAGPAHREIITVCKEEKCDLVVVADKGWSAMERWLLGSTTEKLIRKSPVPVLIVKQ